MKIRNMTEDQVIRYIEWFRTYHIDKDIIYDEVYGTFMIDNYLFRDTEDIYSLYFR